MMEFAKYEHIQKMKDDVLPKVKDFEDLIEGYKLDNISYWIFKLHK